MEGVARSIVYFLAVDDYGAFGYVAVYCVIFMFIFRNREISVALNINVRLYFKFARNRDSLVCQCVVQHTHSSRRARMSRLNNNYKNKILSSN